MTPIAMAGDFVSFRVPLCPLPDSASVDRHYSGQASPGLAHFGPAGDADAEAGHVVGLGRGEERRHARDVVALGDAAQGHAQLALADHQGAVLLAGGALGGQGGRDEVHALSVDQAGADGVDVDVVWGHLVGQGLSETDDGELAGAVGSVAGDAALASARGDVDDLARAAAVDHVAGRQHG